MVEQPKDQMFFRHPSQLLQIFADLEESSLFLIQNNQVAEEGIDELRKKFSETESIMTEKNSVLMTSINELRKKIEAENEKADILRMRAFGGAGTGAQARLLSDLTQHVRNVFELTGHNSENNMPPLEMLGESERFLESLIAQISLMDEEWRMNSEKAKEAARRQRVRKERLNEQQRQYEERMMRTKKRASEVQPKKIGKPVMFRSPPFEPKQKVENESDQQKNDDEEMIKKFFSL